MLEVQTDYLVIGAGANGLAFADTLIAETDAHVTIVDRHAKPGGHWNDAYPFVTLHQPSAFYGVDSLELGSGLNDPVGLNRGLAELASGAEVCGYFERVMNHRLLASGRVAYHPLCHYLGDGVFESLLSGARTRLTVRKKVVDATAFSPTVPSTHTPAFEIGEGAQVVPPNAVPGLVQRAAHGEPMPRRVVVLGAGKTAMDTCLWLLQSGAEADAITWIMPRDSWVTNRRSTQNAPAFFDAAIGGQADQLTAFAQAASCDDLFLRLEACGTMMRIDRERKPTMFHFATLSEVEIDVLRGIRNVVREGRVRAVHADRLVFDHRVIAIDPGALFVDCTASAVSVRATEPVFQRDRIVPQLVRAPLISFSAALIAYVEAHVDDDEQKNRLCMPVPMPRSANDYPRAMQVNLTNQYHWSQHAGLGQWLRTTRLNAFGRLTAGVAKDDADKQATLARLKAQVPAAMANLPRLIASAAG